MKSSLCDCQLNLNGKAFGCTLSAMPIPMNSCAYHVSDSNMMALRRSESQYDGCISMGRNPHDFYNHGRHRHLQVKRKMVNFADSIW